MTKQQVFRMIYETLKYYYFNVEEDDYLGQLLSGMNLDTFIGGAPADSGVWEELNQCMEEVCGSDGIVTVAHIKSILFAFLEMYRAWGYKLDRVILALKNDPNLDRDLEQYAMQEE